MWDLNAIVMDVGKLLLAALLGAAIGLERESHGRYAGLRTNLLVSMGACLLMLVSLHIPKLYAQLSGESVIRLDPARIASYGIAGMGFIGAGAIIKGRGSVRGVTTAATLWLVTGLGLAVGARLYWPAVATTLIALVALYLFRWIRISREVYTTLSLDFHGTAVDVSQVVAILNNQPHVLVKLLGYSQNLSQGGVTLRLQLRGPENLSLELITAQLDQLPGLENLAWDTGEVP